MRTGRAVFTRYTGCSSHPRKLPRNPFRQVRVARADHLRRSRSRGTRGLPGHRSSLVVCNESARVSRTISQDSLSSKRAGHAMPIDLSIFAHGPFVRIAKVADRFRVGINGKTLLFAMPPTPMPRSLVCTFAGGCCDRMNGVLSTAPTHVELRRKGDGIRIV
jgi:hypothetical protein